MAQNLAGMGFTVVPWPRLQGYVPTIKGTDENNTREETISWWQSST